MDVLIHMDVDEVISLWYRSRQHTIPSFSLRIKLAVFHFKDWQYNTQQIGHGFWENRIQITVCLGESGVINLSFIKLLSSIWRVCSREGRQRHGNDSKTNVRNQFPSINRF